MDEVAAGTVLVIDDDPVVVQLLKVSLEMEGYEVLSAGDGELGLSRARLEHPDMVILDVMMPGMDGLDVARRLRQDEATRSLPILILSAKAQVPDIHAGRAVADDYVTKPFDTMELLDRVSALIQGG
ncbi:MAG: response regulator transcription factor [Acidimicrobiales bacterium]